MTVRSHFVTKGFNAYTRGSILNAVSTHTYHAHIPEQLRVYTIGENDAMLGRE